MKLRTIATILLALICAGLITLCFYVMYQKDSTAPVISVTNEALVYMEGTDTAPLIAAVKATDSKDGDVSDSLKIEKLSPNDDGTKIKVQFVAKDKSNNISKLTVTFGYKIDPELHKEKEDKKYNIVLINNLGIENLANSYARVLQKDGHSIVSIGLSDDPPSVETVIYVTHEGDGEELLEHFPSAKILVGNIANRLNVSSEGADAVILLGYQHSIIPGSDK